MISDVGLSSFRNKLYIEISLDQQFPLWLFCHSVGIFFLAFLYEFVKNMANIWQKRFLLNDKKAKAEIAEFRLIFFHKTLIINTLCSLNTNYSILLILNCQRHIRKLPSFFIPHLNQLCFCFFTLFQQSLI
jgi:hypothetical protein